MTFFNKKEEVLEVVLTRIGRKKLASGLFIPSHYEFLDEDILYDIKNLSTSSLEGQNQIKTRIKDKILLRPLTSKQRTVSKTNEPKAENRLIEGLGTFSPYSNYKPAWQIEASDGTLYTSSGEITYVPIEVEKGGALGPSQERIPQFYLTCSYNYNFYVDVDKTDASSKFYADVTENPFIDFDDILKKATDNSFVLFEKDFNDFTINIKENNVLSSSNQFELEVFKYNYSNNYLTASMERLHYDADDITKNSVEWYFNISTDQNIDEEKFAFIDEKVVVEEVDDECV
tara:strand:+ start:22527 stop:23387 length:861 start_codon:yes stop_codon:yes gene_type:complete